MGGRFGGGREQKHTDAMEESEMQRSWGSPRRSQEGMLTLKVSIKITHSHGISMGALPSHRCAREAGDRVFSRVGWGSRPRVVSELISVPVWQPC